MRKADLHTIHEAISGPFEDSKIVVQSLVLDEPVESFHLTG
jgi:hypothetical protein